LDDIENAGILRRKIKEDDWEIEECHYVVRSTPSIYSAGFRRKPLTPGMIQHDPNIAYPRIYNDFFSA
jgi:hypothetical protein